MKSPPSILLIGSALLGPISLLAADSIIVVNPSFQADNFTTFPGYVGGANPASITGWGGSGGRGINATDTAAGTPFADNGAMPDGTRVAFIQGAGSFTQTLAGFELGQTYWVQVWSNARNCCGDVPKLSVNLGGTTLLAPQTLTPVGGAEPYYLANFVWTANATSAALTISGQSAGGGDASMTMDAVAVIKRPATEIVIANPSFEASGASVAYPGYYPNIAGWTKISGGGQSGINTAAGPFLDNGVVPDGANVLLLQQAVAVQQAVAGLVPGQTYRLQLRYNTRDSGDDSTLRVSVGTNVLFESVVTPVGAGQPFASLSVDFTATDETALLKLANVSTAGDSTTLIDNISLTSIGAAVPLPLALPSPGAPGDAGGLVTFNEIHYHPLIGQPEWVEIVNQGSLRADLGGWRIKGGIDFTFADGTTLEPGAYLVISATAGNPAGSLGPFTGALNNAGEKIELVTKQNWAVDAVDYGVVDEWPAAPDGSGVTLAKRSLSFASGASASWTSSAQPGGTPGAANFSATPSLPIPADHVAGPVVINEIFYHAHPTYADPANAVAFAENPSEWIELHNRSASPVDLSGWKLSDAVSYTFPALTTLAPGGFLVVNQLQFSGSLADSGDSIKLRDAADVIVDKVRYRDRRRWSAYADGSGASLELIDPKADNTKPESWAASDESTKTSWQTITYRATGAEPVNSNNPSTWREFLLGFLDSGEALIDDLSVREDPDGANVQVIQNGTFEADTIGQTPAAWRCLGTHKLSVVVADPTGPGKVLKVVATGGNEHTYNTCSTTLVGNRVIDAAKTYEISFRAKWIAGSPQLNTRLYLNRAARTTILNQPATAGTPGAANSRLVANAGPTFQEFVHAPLVPALGQPVTVFARVFDPDGISGLTLFYSINGASFQSAAMSLDGNGRYAGTIPGQPLSSTAVQFYVTATDASAAASSFPAGGAASRALYRVGDGGVAGQAVVNKMRLIMTPADAAFMHNPIHSVSDARFGATLIANDREVYYNVGVRLRSSPYGRQGSRTGWNLDLDPEQPFRGTETDLVFDGAFNMPRMDGSGWQENSLGPSINEMLYQRIAEHAGNIPAEHGDVVYLATPFYESRKAQLRLRRYSNSALDEFTPNGGDGSLFKQEIIYYPTATVNGNPEALKNPYSTFSAVDIVNHGTSADAYRFNYLVQNHADRDDFTGIINMAAAFSGPTGNLYAASDAALDFESWTRTLALNSLTGLADTYNQHLSHNIQFLARPSDGKVMLLPWDMDHAFFFATNFNIYGGDAHRVKDLIADPRVKRRMAGQLYDLCQTTFTNAYLDPWIDHYNTVAEKSYNVNFKNWVAARRAFVLAQINTDWPARSFAITTNLGFDFSTPSPTTPLQGSAWIDVHSIRRAGSVEPLALTWVNGSTWQVVLPVGAGANIVSLEALNQQGQIVGTDTITITNTGSIVPAAAGILAITEIMYHPADPSGAEITAGFIDADQFEFIELQNISANPVDLTGASFTDGITFTFTGGSLAPGGRLLLVSNPAAFAQRYGAGIPIFGTYTGALNNAGDHLLLLDRGGSAILDFTYDDKLPWPTEADGAGHSLTLINPTMNPATASNWRVSAALGGAPNASDSLNQASFPNLLDYALVSFPVETMVAGHAQFTWQQRIAADNVTITPRLSTDLTTWNADPGDGTKLQILSNVVNTDGSRTITARAVEADTRQFFHLLISQRP